MSLLYVLVRVESEDQATSLDDAIQDRRPIAPLGEVTRRLLELPGTRQPPEAEEQIFARHRRLMEETARRMGRSDPPPYRVVCFGEGQDRVEYEIHEDPVDSIGIHRAPADAFRRIVGALCSWWPGRFVILDPQTGAAIDATAASPD